MDGGGRATQDAKAKFTGVNDRLSRAHPMSIANASGALLPKAGSFKRRSMGAKELSRKGPYKILSSSITRFSNALLSCLSCFRALSLL